MTAPADCPRRILLAVTGLSPQVITETLYALAKQNPAFIPTEVHVITTAEGKKRVELALLSQQMGWFYRLCAELKLPTISFSPEHIHCVRAANGEALEDIRSPDDNERLADCITEQVRQLTAEPNSALHASIAGGRKTMGFYLGYALSLYGREQDRLSHVLISEPFESSWDFFYPTTDSRVITLRDNKLADTRDAQVTLADIPFVSLRHGLPDALLTGQSSYSQTVLAARQALAPPQLVIDLTGQRIQAGDHQITLPPRHLALFSVFARRRMNGETALTAPAKEVPDQVWKTHFMREYKKIHPNLMDDIQRTERALAKGMDGDYFSQCKSKLHAKLKDTLGQQARHYLISDGNTRPRRYALKLPAAAIHYGKLATAPPKAFLD